MSLTPKAPQLRAQILGALAKSPTPMIPKEIRAATGLTPGEVNHGTQSARKAGLAALTSAGWVATEAGKAAVISEAPAAFAPKPTPLSAARASVALSLDAVLDAYAAKVAADVVSRIRSRIDMAVAAIDFGLDIETRIATLLQAKLEVSMEDPAEVSLDPLQPASKARLPRVVILGLIPTQEQDVLQSHGDVFDLRFIAMAHPGDVKVRCASADLVIGMTKFMNHKVHDTLKAAGIKYCPCNGSVTALKLALDTYLAEVTAPL